MDPNRPAPGSALADAGVEGNARLTSTTGMVLLALLAIEGLTILSVRSLITLHVFLGILLIGPVLLKTGSTAYRFARYYTGARPYVTKGPPHVLLRLLGPLVVVSSLMLLGTGVALLAVRPSDPGLLLQGHKASFVILVSGDDHPRPGAPQGCVLDRVARAPQRRPRVRNPRAWIALRAHRPCPGLRRRCRRRPVAYRFALDDRGDWPRQPLNRGQGRSRRPLRQSSERHCRGDVRPPVCAILTSRC